MKGPMVSRSLGVAAMAVVLACTGGVARADDGVDQSRIRQGAHIAPVPLALHGKNRALVWLGSYIVNAVGGCNDCHTNPPYVPNPSGGDIPFVNKDKYLAGGTAFGPTISKNLTPDPSGRPAGLTLAEFMHVIRTGHDPDDGHLLQVMPWPVYRNMTDRDLRAVYEYLRSIPSLPNNY